MPTPPDPLSMRDDLASTLQRYVDTAYWLNNPRLMAERRELLSRPGGLVQDAFVEPVLPYDGTDPMLDAAAEVDLTTDEAEWLAQALFNQPAQALSLRTHQAQALRCAMSKQPGQINPVISSGTGSGKTEAFLLPLLTRLLLEARDWPSGEVVNHWWQGPGSAQWTPLRHGGRAAGVRAIVLYPTNALVEDQLARLRRAVRRLEKFGGPRLWFARYTSASPGGSIMPKSGRHPQLEQVVQELRTMVSEVDDVVGAQVGDYLTDPRSGEMVTRWDVVTSPPDLLITNYSMLNVMLMRQLEEPVFASTRRWLEDDPSHVFTLVVDELHLYRGTQGAEVAMILRSLLMRLGLAPDSPQVRVIGTSASLEASDKSRSFLQRFFGVPSNTFALISGSPRRVEATLPLPADAMQWAGRRLDHALVEACRGDDGRARATPVGTIRSRLSLVSRPTPSR